MADMHIQTLSFATYPVLQIRIVLFFCAACNTYLFKNFVGKDIHFHVLMIMRGRVVFSPASLGSIDVL